MLPLQAYHPPPVQPPDGYSHYAPPLQVGGEFGRYTPVDSSPLQYSPPFTQQPYHPSPLAPFVTTPGPLVDDAFSPTRHLYTLAVERFIVLWDPSLGPHWRGKLLAHIDDPMHPVWNDHLGGQGFARWAYMISNLTANFNRVREVRDISSQAFFDIIGAEYNLSGTEGNKVYIFIKEFETPTMYGYLSDREFSTPRPCLTLRGLMQVMAFEIAYSPQDMYRAFNQIPGGSHIPRHCFPELPDPHAQSLFRQWERVGRRIDQWALDNPPHPMAQHVALYGAFVNSQNAQALNQFASQQSGIM